MTEFTWTLLANVDKPKWILIGFQTDKNVTQEQNPALFDHLNLTRAHVFVNSQKFPLHDISLNFARNDYEDAYTMQNIFKEKYYGFNNLIGGSQINYPGFKTLFPIFVFDVTNQDDLIKNIAPTINVNFYFRENTPVNAVVYAVVISDRLYKMKADGTDIVKVTR